MTKTLGLYLHVPFCASKCRYCDFYSFAAGDDQMEAYTEALCRSIGDWGATCADYTVDTVYFGGGTPSLLGGVRLVRVLDAARSAFAIASDAEITVECNPDSMDETLLDALHRAGVNRLSVGVQSADEGELRRLGRRHSFAQAVDAVQRAQAAGFSNLSLDLMYGLPGQTRNAAFAVGPGAAGVKPHPSVGLCPQTRGGHAAFLGASHPAGRGCAGGYVYVPVPPAPA